MENHTLFCPKPFKFTKHKTLPEYLLDQAKHFGKLGKSAYLIDGLSDETRYFKNFDQETRSVASKFFKNGLRKGEIVICMSSRQIQQVLLITGVWRANSIARSLYAEESPETILEKVKESKARWIFCDIEAGLLIHQEVASKVDWPLEVLVVGQAGSDKQVPAGCISFDVYLNDDGSQCPNLNVTEHDLALILPTSGTTGPSKGAMHSHKSMLENILRFSMFPFSTIKCNLIASKSTHVSGICFPLAVFSLGATGVVLPKIDKEICIRTVDKYKPAVAFAFPTFLMALGSSEAKGFDISSVEIFLIGGVPTTSAMKAAFLNIGNVNTVINVYGMTECPLIASTLDVSKNPQFITYPDAPTTSVGRILPGPLVQIRDLQESLNVLGPHKKGEIFLRGDVIFIGYFQNTKATKEAFVDGWFRTGDVGYYDELGYLFVVDRKKDIFKYLNNHISPTELEDVIFKHPFVQEVSVISVPDEFGDVPRAFVTLKDIFKVQDKAKVSEEIIQYANDNLASYQAIRGGLYIVDELPKGKTGKIERNLIAKLQV